jgi:hypothetical protein
MDLISTKTNTHVIISIAKNLGVLEMAINPNHGLCIGRLLFPWLARIPGKP